MWTNIGIFILVFVAYMQDINILIGVDIDNFNVFLSHFSYKYIDLYKDKYSIFSYLRTIYSLYLLIALFGFDMQHMLMVMKSYRPMPTPTIITTIKMKILPPKLVKQGFGRYNKITLIDNINLLPTSYKEDQNIVMLRVAENEIEKVFQN